MVAVIAALVILFLPSFVATFCAAIRQRHCGRDDATPVAAITLGLVKQQGYALSSAAMKRSITPAMSRRLRDWSGASWLVPACECPPWRCHDNARHWRVSERDGRRLGR